MSTKTNLQLIKALNSDVKEITELMVRVYNDDHSKWAKTKTEGFMPGYNSEKMQEFIIENRICYKIMYENRTIGVTIIDYLGGYHARLDKLYIDLDYQDKKLGTAVMELIENSFPEVTIWTLDTYKKSLRNQHFYEKLGYTKIAESEDEVYYKKIIENKNLSYRHSDEDLSKIEYMDCNMAESDYYSINLKKSMFTNVNMSEINVTDASINNASFTNTNMSGTLFGDSRMDDIEICHASLGGAYFHDTNLGWFDENKPINFERCDLKNSKITSCDLSNLEIDNCNMKNMKIHGISVEEMINTYNKFKK